MKYCKLENNVVVQTQRSLETGFIECPEFVVPGFIKNGANFSPPTPPPPPSVNDKRNEFEKSIPPNLSLLIEAIEDIQGLPPGAIISAAKSRVVQKLLYNDNYIN